MISKSLIERHDRANFQFRESTAAPKTAARAELERLMAEADARGIVVRVIEPVYQPDKPRALVNPAPSSAADRQAYLEAVVAMSPSGDWVTAAMLDTTPTAVQCMLSRLRNFERSQDHAGWLVGDPQQPYAARRELAASIPRRPSGGHWLWTEEQTARVRQALRGDTLDVMSLAAEIGRSPDSVAARVAKWIPERTVLAKIRAHYDRACAEIPSTSVADAA